MRSLFLREWRDADKEGRQHAHVKYICGDVCVMRTRICVIREINTLRVRVCACVIIREEIFLGFFLRLAEKFLSGMIGWQLTADH